ncbi:ABC-type dipeptide/oligopeptide/nickel transport system permease component [Ralstonia pickettii]
MHEMLEDIRLFWRTERTAALFLFASILGLVLAGAAGVTFLVAGNVLAFAVSVFAFLIFALPVFVLSTVNFASAQWDRRQAKHRGGSKRSCQIH